MRVLSIFMGAKWLKSRKNLLILHVLRGGQ